MDYVEVHGLLLVRQNWAGTQMALGSEYPQCACAIVRDLLLQFDQRIDLHPLVARLGMGEMDDGYTSVQRGAHPLHAHLFESERSPFLARLSRDSSQDLVALALAHRTSTLQFQVRRSRGRVAPHCHGNPTADQS